MVVCLKRVLCHLGCTLRKRKGGKGKESLPPFKMRAAKWLTALATHSANIH